MKSALLVILATASMVVACAQEKKPEDKTKRPSPPAQTKATLASGAALTIDYSQPSLKGRTIGKDVEPMNGKVWRTGANEATTFEVTKDVKVEGKTLTAGKYALFTIANDDQWTIIFNKTADQWGAEDYKEADDVLRVNVKPGKATQPVEKFTIKADKSGLVTILWGDRKVDFKVE